MSDSPALPDSQQQQAAVRPNPWVAALLLIVPLILYGSQIGRWGIDSDEFYTFHDSSLPIAKLLEWETKPVYYMLCHALLQRDLGWPLEVTLRLPSALASSLIPVTAYWLLWNPRRRLASLATAILLLVNPWIFSFAVTARFYGMTTWLSLLATGCVVRFLRQPHWGWGVGFVISATLATAVHTAAALLFPAAVLALICVGIARQPEQFRRLAVRWGPAVSVVCLVGVAFAYWILHRQIAFWLSSKEGEFGSYSIAQLSAAIALNIGVPVCGLAILPLASCRRWSRLDLSMAVMATAGSLPLVALVLLNAGGVAPRYLMPGMVAVFILAGEHWAGLHRRLRQPAWQLTLAACIMAFYLPYFASAAADGGHFNYRAAAEYVDDNYTNNPILIATGHLILEHFLEQDTSVHELTEFEQGVPRPRLEKLIDQAEASQRELIIVSRESRHTLSPADQQWLYQRFALIRTFAARRYDHRTHRMAIYQYRPATRQACTAKTVDSAPAQAADASERAVGVAVSEAHTLLTPAATD